MAKTKVSEWSSTASSNTDIDSINIAEGCAPSGINDAIRELMSQIKDFQAGTYSDSFNGPVGTTTAAAGAFTTLTASSTATLNTLASSGATLTGGSINNMAIGASTASSGAFTTLAASGAVTLSGGTANGVAYLNGSKVLTTGSALTFNGTSLTIPSGSAEIGAIVSGQYFDVINGDAVNAQRIRLTTSGTNGVIQVTRNSGTVPNLIFKQDSSELMRLTSTGLGIGTSSPATRLDIVATNDTNGFTLRQNATYNAGTELSLKITENTGVTFDCSDGVSTGRAFIFTSGTTEKMRLDSSGNLGLGVTPPTSSAGTMFVGANKYISSTGNGLSLASNYTFNAGAKYVATAAASLYEQYSGQHAWYTAASGTAGNAITWTQAMTLDASGRLLIGGTSAVTGSANGSVDISNTSGDLVSITRFVNASGGTAMYFNKSRGATVGTNTIVASGDSLGALYFRGANGTGYSEAAYILGAVDGTPGASADMPGRLVFATSADGSATPTERMRIDSSGNLLVGTTTVSGLTTISANSNVKPLLGFLDTNTTSTSYRIIDFNRNGTQTGTITITNTTTAYGTSSDYRLKNTIAPMTGALAKVALLKPCTYKWNVDGSDGEGFIAHELAEVVPQCVTGEKDAVDEDGNPVYQGIDTSFLVATLTAAIQELKAEFDAYKASHP